ncbi:AbrB/MazE/SpoVT family DNA-binding domain-containing protein [Halomicrobium urmianum]|uniref:AbrB/MazE/SpoVT family DNA-binding domain-containing protein n=1 Tax=Halomicrobium urmianum TaxID=1586233 RepID=UPI001CD95A64|nr:AbrB/MazE/SpoVT family DNA-binding domain-containing protein [Halomicrobium urmianum]
MTVETDSHGRLYLSKDVRDKYGEKYHVVEYEDKIELIPIADDPLAAVREAAGELRETPHEEIENAIEEEAAKDAGRTDE